MDSQKRIGAYLRVSTAEQSTELQSKEIKDYLAARGWKNVTFYEDAAMSGTHGNRPQLKQLLRDARGRKVDIVVCWKLDRLFRSLKDLVVTLQEFQDLGVEFISLKDNIDLTTASGRLLMQIIGAMAEFEAALIKERVRAGLRNAKAKGKRLGRPPICEHAAVAQFREQGLSVRQIAKRVDISHATVHRIVSKTLGKTQGIAQ